MLIELMGRILVDESGRLKNSIAESLLSFLLVQIQQ